MHQLSDDVVEILGRYGGPKAERWARRAAAINVHNRTTARSAYLCMVRVIHAAIDYEPPQWVRDSMGVEHNPHTGKMARRRPCHQLQQIVVLYTQAWEDRWPGTISRPRGFFPTDKDRILWRRRNKCNRLPASLRRKVYGTMREMAERRAEDSIGMRWISIHRLQEQDDNEARRAGERVY